MCRICSAGVIGVRQSVSGKRLRGGELNEINGAELRYVVKER